MKHVLMGGNWNSDSSAGAFRIDLRPSNGHLGQLAAHHHGSDSTATPADVAFLVTPMAILLLVIFVPYLSYLFLAAIVAIAAMPAMPKALHCICRLLPRRVARPLLKVARAIHISGKRAKSL